MTQTQDLETIDYSTLTTEEKFAWDSYAAAAINGRLAGKDGIGSSGAIASKAAAVADAMFLERMKRFN
jgi:hypothetical protein